MAQLDEKELDGVLISAPENRRYLSGFTGSAGYLFITPDQAVLGTDFRYTEQAGKQAPGFEIVMVKGGWSWLLELLKKTPLKKLGFESQDMTVASYQNVLKALKEEPSLSEVSLVATPGIVDPLRAIKEPEELVLIQKAIDASGRRHGDGLPYHPGGHD